MMMQDGEDCRRRDKEEHCNYTGQAAWLVDHFSTIDSEAGDAKRR